MKRSYTQPLRNTRPEVKVPPQQIAGLPILGSVTKERIFSCILLLDSFFSKKRVGLPGMCRAPDGVASKTIQSQVARQACAQKSSLGKRPVSQREPAQVGPEPLQSVEASPFAFSSSVRFLARHSASAARSTTQGTRIAGCYRQNLGPLFLERSFLFVPEP